MKLSSKIYIGFGFILLLFVILTLINLQLARKTQDLNSRLNLTEQIFTKSANMQRFMLDMEDDLRGYLLTGNSDFLAPYNKAISDFGDMDSSAMDLLNNNDVQQGILIDIAGKIKIWRDSFASPLVAAKANSLANKTKEADEIYKKLLLDKAGMGGRKNITDNIRADFNEFDHVETHEKRLLDGNLKTSIKNEEIVLFFLASLCLISGLIIAVYIGLTISYRIRTIKENIDTIASGKFNASIIDTQRDELSGLAEAVNVMSENLKEKILTLEAENKILQRELKSKNRSNP